MLSAFHFIKRHFINILTTTSISVFSIFIFHPGAFPVIGIGLGTYIATNFITKQIQLRQIYKKTGLSRIEYKHIAEQLQKADERMSHLNKYFIRVRSIQQFKQLLEIHLLAKNILKIVKNDPKKFYHVESFFYAHLESATLLTDKFTMLSQQPVKDTEIQQALAETRATLSDLHGTMEDDLKLALTDDIEHLKMEIEFAKLSNQNQAEQLHWRGEEK